MEVSDEKSLEESEVKLQKFFNSLPSVFWYYNLIRSKSPPSYCINSTSLNLFWLHFIDIIYKVLQIQKIRQMI